MIPAQDAAVICADNDVGAGAGAGADADAGSLRRTTKDVLKLRVFLKFISFML